VQYILNEDIIIEKVKIVELTLKNGSTMLCRGDDDMVRTAWTNYPVVSAQQTGDEETIQWSNVEYE
jgi:hypothetical protein